MVNEQGLLAAEEARRQAMQAGDIQKLEGLLSGSLSYMHSTGAQDGKESYLKRLASGGTRYETLDFVEPKARLFGNTGMVSGLIRATVVNGETRREVASYYLAVWQYTDTGTGAGWLLEAVQATPLPAKTT